MFNFANNLRRAASSNFNQKAKFFFSEGGNQKFIPKNNSKKVIGGSIALTSVLLYGIYKKSNKDNEFYSEEELKKQGIFIDDQKAINQNKKALDAQLSLEVKPWVLQSQSGQISSEALKGRYYFVLLGHNQSMVDKLQLVFQNIKQLAQTKYYLSPEFDNYKQDIENPIVLSIDSQNIQLNVTPNFTILNGDSQQIERGFKKLFIKNYEKRIFLVDGLNGQAVSVKLAENSDYQLIGMFILNYLNEASIFRNFLQ
ncbi:hypothetical protein ABPG72_006696 [Tetrahymena utriculariae]